MVFGENTVVIIFLIPYPCRCKHKKEEMFALTHYIWLLYYCKHVYACDQLLFTYVYVHILITYEIRVLTSNYVGPWPRAGICSIIRGSPVRGNAGSY